MSDAGEGLLVPELQEIQHPLNGIVNRTSPMIQPRDQSLDSDLARGEYSDHTSMANPLPTGRRAFEWWTPMATIEILSWRKDFVGFTGWDAHAKSELRRRLRSGVNAPQHEIKRLARQIHARELVSLHHVREEAVYGVTQILQTEQVQTFVLH